MTDIAPQPAAQPEGDGGNGGTGSLPWDLNDVPEELRGYVSDQLKRIEGGITQRFQESAEFRRKMEPLSSLAEIEGISDVPVEELQALLEFRGTLGDQEAFEEWWTGVGEELGLFDDGDSPDDDEEPQQSGDVTPPWAQQLIDRLEALEGGVAETQSSVALDRQQQKIAADLKALEDEHGEFDVDAVTQLAMAHSDQPDAIARGFADLQRITGKAQGALVEEKESVPGGRPLSGGSVNGSTEPVKGFANAEQIARQRFAGARS